MERDFLGLSLKEPLAVVKEEVNNDGFKEIGFCNGSGVQWPFSNKVYALPHLMSFKGTLGDKTKKVGTDPLVSPGFMPVPSTDANDPSQKRSTAEIQMFPVSNQPISVSLSNTFFPNHYAIAGQNLAGNTVKPQIYGGIPVAAPHILPTIGSVGKNAESWNNVKACGSPAQLTIFYAGMVNVFDDISPEKAQAIMLLAGNGSSMASMMAHPKVQIHAPSLKPAAGDGIAVNQPISTPPSSGLSSPLSVSSHTGAQSGSGSTCTDDIKIAGVTTTPISKVEPPMVNAVGSVTTTTMIPSVPQARKASLARFLEKRKERVMNSAPYHLSMKSAECTTAESKGVDYSAASAAGTGPFLVSKEG